VSPVRYELDFYILEDGILLVSVYIKVYFLHCMIHLFFLNVRPQDIQ
jgi:hypothetical protein